MKTLKGRTAASGLAEGIACLYDEKTEEKIPHYGIDQERVDNEIIRVENAYKKAKNDIQKILGAAEKMFGKIGGEIFNAHSTILEDRSLREGIIKLTKDKLINAEHAVNDIFENYIEQLKGKQSHFAEITHDIIDVRNRILSSFSGDAGKFACPAGERKAVVVVSKRLTPSMVMSIPKEYVLAFVTEEGGFTTHATILARNYGVPVIFDVNVANNISCGDRVIVDGIQGQIIVDPDNETNAKYLKKRKALLKKKAVCQMQDDKPTRTKKKSRIILKANISTPGEVELLKNIHYDGVGLLRSEFILTSDDKVPTEDEWFNIYRNVLESVKGKQVVIRLLDIGGDKMPGYIKLPEQENPDLGIRGARALSLFYEIYLRQIRAILRASNHGDLSILYPMVSDASDVEDYREILRVSKKQLCEEKIPFNNSIKEGIMIETPSAAIMADSLLEIVDFANIGSNDLIQYTLAASRGNQLIEKRYHILHPSLVRLMENIVKAGKNHKKEICLCGEIAGFEEYYPLFLGIGLRSFSVSASQLDAIKCYLISADKADIKLVNRFYKARTKEDIDKVFAQK